MHDFTLDGVFGPHTRARVLVRGNVKNPRTALVLLHGRGASAEHIIGILDTLSLPEWVIILVPEAKDKIWFPGRFYDPRQHNEPHLTSALSVVEALVDTADRNFSIGTNDVVLAGFSQGACLTAEYVIERPAQFKGVCIFSGGLIGTEPELDALSVKKSLVQTPIYMGCDVEDPHVPLTRFKRTRTILEQAGAVVTYKEYEGLRHAIHMDGMQFLGQLLRMG